MNKNLTLLNVYRRILNIMRKKLAIVGHPTRGKEVIELLEMMGGKNKDNMFLGKDTGCIYFIDGYEFIRKEIIVDSVHTMLYWQIFTLEEFLEKYPFKVGDKAVYEDDNDIVVVNEIKWNNTVGDIIYNVKIIDEDDCFLCPPELLKPYKKTNMNKKLAIKGHSTRGKEVIKLLEMLGGINDEGYIGTNTWKDEYYFLDNGCIHAYDWCDGIKFTLEEFLEKYPFKVGDKVFLYDNITEGCVTGMEWDENKGTVKYCVYTSAECWCNVEELLKWNNIDLNERHYMDNMKEKDKAKAPDIKGEDYSGKRFGYKIPDGYEFDVVVDGKIFIKPINPKYPTTYEDCCKVLGISYRAQLSYTNPEVECSNIYLTKEKHLLDAFMKLRICRNAYWKIASEEMGLGKPWEPDWTNEEQKKYCIYYSNGNIQKGTWCLHNSILAFPSEEMRDVFFEDFKDLFEQCKEFL